MSERDVARERERGIVNDKFISRRTSLGSETHVSIGYIKTFAIPNLRIVAGAHIRRDRLERRDREGQEHAGGRRFGVPASRHQVRQSERRRADDVAGAEARQIT